MFGLYQQRAKKEVCLAGWNLRFGASPKGGHSLCKGSISERLLLSAVHRRDGGVVAEALAGAQSVASIHSMKATVIRTCFDKWKTWSKRQEPHGSISSSPGPLGSCGCPHWQKQHPVLAR